MAWSSAAHAQASRTWVSGVGVDSDPCSRDLPCRTFAGAINKTAAGGEINVLDSGGLGAITITKSITIDGGSAVGGVLVLATNGITVNDGGAHTAVVVLRNLDINGLNSTSGPAGQNGIVVVSGASLDVENSKIYGFGTNGILVQSGTARVRGSSIINNRSAASSDAAGIFADGAGVVVSVEDNQISGNDVGVRVANGGTIRIAGNSLYDNGTGVAGCSKDPAVGTILTLHDNRVLGDTGGPVAPCKPKKFKAL